MTSEEKSRLIILLQKDKVELAQRHEETVRKLEELLRSQSETTFTLRSLTEMLTKSEAQNAALRSQLADAMQENTDLIDRQKRDSQSCFGRKS